MLYNFIYNLFTMNQEEVYKVDRDVIIQKCSRCFGVEWDLKENKCLIKSNFLIRCFDQYKEKQTHPLVAK